MVEHVKERMLSTFEAVCVTTYVEDYLDYVENFSNVIQPYISNIRRLDAKYFDILKKLNEAQSQLRAAKSTEERKKLCREVKILLAQGQWNGDEKLQELVRISELVDAKIANLDNDAKNFEPQKPPEISSRRNSMSIGGIQGDAKTSSDISRSFPVSNDSCSRSERLGTPGTSASKNVKEESTIRHSGMKRSRRQKQFPDYIRDPDVASVKKENSTTSNSSTVLSTYDSCNVNGSGGTQNSGQKGRKRRKKGKTSTLGVPYDIPADPDEPTYCLCEQVSYGEMIGCDNYRCEIEWYHFSCVGLTTKPKGKWYCPTCRGDKPNIMKSSLSSK